MEATASDAILFGTRKKVVIDRIGGWAGKPELGQKYGLGGAVDGAGGYSWGGANGTQFWIDREYKLFVLFMVQTQLSCAPIYLAFRNLVNESVGIVGRNTRLTEVKENVVKGVLA